MEAILEDGNAGFGSNLYRFLGFVLKLSFICWAMKDLIIVSVANLSHWFLLMKLYFWQKKKLIFFIDETLFPGIKKLIFLFVIFFIGIIAWCNNCCIMGKFAFKSVSKSDISKKKKLLLKISFWLVFLAVNISLYMLVIMWKNV